MASFEKCGRGSLNGKKKESFQAFLNKELSVTSRYGATPKRPERIRSAKGRLENSPDVSQNRELCCHSDISRIDDGSSGAKNTHSSGGKALHRRPLSAVSSKAKLLVKDQGKQSSKNNTPPKYLKAKGDLFRDCESIFKFEIQGASIQNSKTGQAYNSEKSCQSNTSNSPGDVHTWCDSDKMKKQPRSSVLDSSLLQREIGDTVKESFGQVGEDDGSCFLTETRDESEDDSETAEVQGPDNSLPRRRKTIASRPRNVFSVLHSQCNDKRTRSQKSIRENDWFSVKPSVYNLEFTKEGVHRSDERKDDGEFPYKLNAQTKTETALVPVVSDLVEDVTWKSHLGRPIPSTLEPLKDFIQECSGEDEKKLHSLTGINSDNCLVFLPDLDTYNLAVIDQVPSVQHVDDDLPYKEIVVSPESWAPKKYVHSFKPIEIPEWKCCHNKGHAESSRYIKKDRKRTIELVRKEIVELEELLKGIGLINSECVVAQYQADITKLQTAVKDTLKKCPKRIRPLEKPDHFGWQRFHRDHEATIRRIREQHAVCLKELSMLEEEAHLVDEKRHFSKQMKDVVCDHPMKGKPSGKCSSPIFNRPKQSPGDGD